MTEDAHVPATVSQSGFDRQTARLRLNFRVAAITNVVAVTILLGFATAAIVFAVLGQPLAAEISGSVGVLDVIYGALERPWRQLWIANNRIALTESVWIAYLESKDAIEREGEPRWRFRC